MMGNLKNRKFREASAAFHVIQIKLNEKKMINQFNTSRINNNNNNNNNSSYSKQSTV